ncbi:murein DD-endopeptidase MepM/ murein hydrolase activator NlpD [Evansella vedderi]|uniref:Murein DD-endopeptidase MepM/ murein hydrolase activator NlpD n=1 Tax=Evansella vedderi TaxID=38282 RepID=A0ABU0A490_9BACI|nr:M23 family metallopeptidase [Evansella vedderi]MDQ0257919.1 murein DD-endopeptidase MepM/ murein hydrolase activator NlpD [Evansella vedderi]
MREIELEIPGEIGDGSGGMEYSLDSNEDMVDVSRRLMEMREELPSIIKEFEETVERILAYEKELRTIPTIMPTEEGRISSRFGYRRDPFTWNSSFHSGIDIAAPINTGIHATADGKVVHADWDGGYGRKVVIEHNETYTTIYAHLNRIDVQVGDEVSKGDLIGGMGTTGRSTGVHLHYEIIRDGEHVDPYLYMTFHEDQN